MSREKNLRRLKSNLHETQDILDNLISETASDVGARWNATRAEAARRFDRAASRLQKAYEDTRSQLQASVRDGQKNWQKQGSRMRKDLNKSYDKNRSRMMAGTADARANLKVTAKKAQLKAGETGEELKHRTVGLLEGVAAGVLTARNRLDPKHRMLVRSEKERYPVGTAGYFKRFMAVAIAITAKRKRLISLGYQAYNKLQDSGARTAFKTEARNQFDTMRRLMRAYARGEYRNFPYRSLLKIVAAVVYFVSVADLIPDFLPIIGYTDDLAILAWVYSSVKDDLQMFTDWEEINEKRRERIEKQRAEAAKSGSSTTTAATASTSASTTGSTAPASDRSASPAGESNRTQANKEAEKTGSMSSGSSSSNRGSSPQGGSSSTGNTGSSGSSSGSSNPSSGATNR